MPSIAQRADPRHWNDAAMQKHGDMDCENGWTAAALKPADLAEEAERNNIYSACPAATPLAQAHWKL